MLRLLARSVRGARAIQRQLDEIEIVRDAGEHQATAVRVRATVPLRSAVLAVSLRSFSRFKSANHRAGWPPPVEKESTAWRLSGIQLARGTKLKFMSRKMRRGVPPDSGKGSTQICGATPLAISRIDLPSGEKCTLLPADSSGISKGAGR